MSAANALARFRAEGFTLATDGRTLLASPRSRLTDDDREELRYLKPDILAILALEARGDPDDDRRRCHECRHHSVAAYRCANYRGALLMSPEVGGDLAGLPQHCPGFGARQEAAQGVAESHVAPGARSGGRNRRHGPGNDLAGASGGKIDEASPASLGDTSNADAPGIDRQALRQTSAPVKVGVWARGSFYRPFRREGGADA